MKKSPPNMWHGAAEPVHVLCLGLLVGLCCWNLMISDQQRRHSDQMSHVVMEHKRLQTSCFQGHKGFQDERVKVSGGNNNDHRKSNNQNSNSHRNRRELPDAGLNNIASLTKSRLMVTDHPFPVRLGRAVRGRRRKAKKNLLKTRKRCRKNKRKKKKQVRSGIVIADCSLIVVQF